MWALIRDWRSAPWTVETERTPARTVACSASLANTDMTTSLRFGGDAPGHKRLWRTLHRDQESSHRRATFARVSGSPTALHPLLRNRSQRLTAAIGGFKN